MSKFNTLRSITLRSALVTLALATAASNVYAKKGGNPHDDGDDDGRDHSTRPRNTRVVTPPVVTAPLTVDNLLTGCLHKEGQLRRLEEGDTPRKPCNRNEKVVQLVTAGTSNVEPFALAFRDGETRVLAQGGLQLALTCAAGNAALDVGFAPGTAGTILNPPPLLPMLLTEPVADTTLPALLGSDGSVLSVHGVHVASNQLGASCIVTGVVQRSLVDFP